MIWIRLLGAAGATGLFAMIFHAPWRSVLPATLTGTAAYAMYLLVVHLNGSAAIASFFGGLVAGIFAEVLARRMRMPATIFASIGVIPLVPGGGLYNTMQLISEGDYVAAASTGVETLLMAGGIAMALAVVTAFWPVKHKKKDSEAEME